jgi:hypothetical protein
VHLIPIIYFPNFEHYDVKGKVFPVQAVEALRVARG